MATLQDLELAMEHFAEAAKPMLGYASTAFNEIKSVLVTLLDEVKTAIATAEGKSSAAQAAVVNVGQATAAAHDRLDQVDAPPSQLPIAQPVQPAAPAEEQHGDSNSNAGA
jgi:hypothetical protein